MIKKMTAAQILSLIEEETDTSGEVSFLASFPSGYCLGDNDGQHFAISDTLDGAIQDIRGARACKCDACYSTRYAARLMKKQGIK